MTRVPPWREFLTAETMRFIVCWPMTRVTSLSIGAQTSPYFFCARSRASEWISASSARTGAKVSGNQRDL